MVVGTRKFWKFLIAFLVVAVVVVELLLIFGPRPVKNVKAVERPTFGDAMDDWVRELEGKKWKWILDNLAELRRQEERARAVSVFHEYMTAHGFTPGLIEQAGLMYDLGVQYGFAPGLCVITAEEESGAGHILCGDFNPFGMLGRDFTSWEDAVRSYWAQIDKNCGVTGRRDTWHIAWYWYGGGDDKGGRSTNYANNISGAVERLRW